MPPDDVDLLPDEDGYAPYYMQRIAVRAARTGERIPEALVTLHASREFVAATHSSISDATGTAYFDELDDPRFDELGRPLEFYAVDVDADGYLPMRTVVPRLNRKETEIFLVDEDAQHALPWLEAGERAAFEIPGVGVLRVGGAGLSSAAQLRLVVCPAASWSGGLASARGQPRHQIWLGAFDARGNLDPDAIRGLAGEDGIRLETALPFEQVIPGMTDEVWTAQNFGYDFEQSSAATVDYTTTDDDRSITIPLAGGFTQLVHDYRVTTTATTGPWEFEFRAAGDRYASVNRSNIICGYVDASGSSSYVKGTTVLQCTTVDASAVEDVGLAATTPVAALRGGASLGLGGSLASRTWLSAQTTAGEAYREGTLSGEPRGRQPGKLDCLSGKIGLGMRMETWTLHAVRTGPSGIEDVRLGVFTENKGLELHFRDLVQDRACGDCDRASTDADDLPRAFRDSITIE